MSRGFQQEGAGSAISELPIRTECGFFISQNLADNWHHAVAGGQCAEVLAGRGECFSHVVHCAPPAESLENPVCVKTGARASVAGSAVLDHMQEDGVRVAIQADGGDFLGMAGGFSLDPVFAARA